MGSAAKRGAKKMVMQRTEARANSLFMVYYQMGQERSLYNLLKLLAGIGQKISFNTLKRYSADFHWQDRLLEVDARVQAEREKQAAIQIDDMNKRQAQLGMAMQSLGALSFKSALESRKPLKAVDAATVTTQGAKLERLARGEVTERREVEVQVYNTVVREIVALFVRVNIIPDSEERKREFAVGADRIIEARLKEGKGTA